MDRALLFALDISHNTSPRGAYLGFGLRIGIHI